MAGPCCFGDLACWTPVSGQQVSAARVRPSPGCCHSSGRGTPHAQCAPKLHTRPTLAQVSALSPEVCKTVGFAFPGSNPGPATRNRSSDTGVTCGRRRRVSGPQHRWQRPCAGVRARSCQVSGPAGVVPRDRAASLRRIHGDVLKCQRPAPRESDGRTRWANRGRRAGTRVPNRRAIRAPTGLARASIAADGRVRRPAARGCSRARTGRSALAGTPRRSARRTTA